MRESVADALDAGQVLGDRQSLNDFCMAFGDDETVLIGDQRVVGVAGHLDAEEAVQSGAFAEELIAPRGEAEPAAHVADALIDFPEEVALPNGWIDHGGDSFAWEERPV